MLKRGLKLFCSQKISFSREELDALIKFKNERAVESYKKVLHEQKMERKANQRAGVLVFLIVFTVVGDHFVNKIRFN